MASAMSLGNREEIVLYIDEKKNEKLLRCGFEVTELKVELWSS